MMDRVADRQQVRPIAAGDLEGRHARRVAEGGAQSSRASPPPLSSGWRSASARGMISRGHPFAVMGGSASGRLGRGGEIARDPAPRMGGARRGRGAVPVQLRDMDAMTMRQQHQIAIPGHGAHAQMVGQEAHALIAPGGATARVDDDQRAAGPYHGHGVDVDRTPARRRAGPER